MSEWEYGSAGQVRPAWRCTAGGQGLEVWLTTDRSRTRSAAPFAYEGLDRIIHERARLSVLTSLVINSQGLTFGELKQLCGLTDGNLSRHLQVLEEAGLVTVFKASGHNRSITLCRLTPAGRERYVHYLRVLERVVMDAEVAVKRGPESVRFAVRGSIEESR